MIKREIFIIVLFVALVIRVASYYDNSVINEVDFRRQGTGVGDETTPWQYMSNVIKSKAQLRIQQALPSPHSELLLGTLLGIDNLNMVPRYNDVLVRTGTVHVVVVSGFNISLIYFLVIRIIGTQYKIKNLLIALGTTFGYAVICGLEAPVIRAWIMASVAAWGKLSGRTLDGLRVLVASAALMVLINPAFIESLSFQLSFMATLSLMLISPVLGLVIRKKHFPGSFLVEDLSTTLSAQVLVWPLISFYFGRVSVVSPLVNALILWTVPLATVMGGIFLILTFVSPLLAGIFSWVVYVPLDIFVRAVTFFGNLGWADTQFKVSLTFLVLYYVSVFVGLCVGRRYWLST